MSQPITFTDLQLLFKKKCKGFYVFKQWFIYTIDTLKSSALIMISLT